ncbi:hypothetical protein FISHEDRAFT_78187 [Fistulina hepatica ATCC 64428]|nr:hypothetical protein FISHEDRAFT_78187 [Fistulina hepatica ATCC 64428]
MSSPRNFALYQLQNHEVNCTAGSQAAVNTSAPTGEVSSQNPANESVSDHAMPDDNSLTALSNEGRLQAAHAGEESPPVGTTLPSISVTAVPQHGRSADEMAENRSSSLSSLPPSSVSSELETDSRASVSQTTASASRSSVRFLSPETVEERMRHEGELANGSGRTVTPEGNIADEETNLTDEEAREEHA